MPRANGYPQHEPYNGRPNKLTPERQEIILSLLQGGNYFTTACNAAGVTPETVYKWMRAYRDGNVVAGQYASFFEAIPQAIAQGQANQLGVIEKAAREGTWQAAAWILERRFPSKWGRREIVDIRGADDLSGLSDEELQKLQTRFQRRAKIGP